MVDFTASNEKVVPTIKLNSGYEMPQIGLGLFLSKEGNLKDLITHAVLKEGYRHIDGAMVYENEEEVGEALEAVFEAGFKREDLFITGKLWHKEKNDVEAAVDACLKRLGLEYLDLYLIHWMRADWDPETFEIKSPPHYLVWKNMEEMVKKGKTKSIGVSNCTIPML